MWPLFAANSWRGLECGWRIFYNNCESLTRNHRLESKHSMEEKTGTRRLTADPTENSPDTEMYGGSHTCAWPHKMADRCNLHGHGRAVGRGSQPQIKAHHRANGERGAPAQAAPGCHSKHVQLIIAQPGPSGRSGRPHGGEWTSYPGLARQTTLTLHAGKAFSERCLGLALVLALPGVMPTRVCTPAPAHAGFLTSAPDYNAPARARACMRATGNQREARPRLLGSTMCAETSRLHASHSQPCVQAS